MRAHLSRERIESFVGDVLPLSLVGDDIDENTAVAWRVEGASAAIRGFASGGEYSFANGVLVTLLAEGESRVIASLGGVEYAATVSARPMRCASSDDRLNYYVGDMHDHTSMNHNRAQFATHEYGKIEDYLKCIEDEALLDFGVISDHADVTNDYDFFRGFELTRDAKAEDEGVIVFAGAESEVMYAQEDRLGVLHRMSGEIVTINSAGYASVRSWDDFYRDTAYSPRAIAIFAHPHVVGFSTNGIWNFDFMKNNTPRMLEMARGMEMGNGEDRKENLLHEYAYSAALDAGFRISTTCGSDSHGPEWGARIMPGKTVIMAPERSREAFIDALVNNRFYATESGNVKLRYTVNGSAAPADLALANEYNFHVELSYFHEDSTTRPTLLEVISDYGESVYSAPICKKDVVDFVVASDSARYFYLRLVDELGRKTWSAPVFCGRPYDRLEEHSLDAIPPCEMTAYVNGEEQPRIVNGDPFDSWCADSPTAAVDIDLGRVRRVSGVAYYPHMVLRGKDKGSDWTTSVESAGILSRYSVSVSTDGEGYTEVARKRAQTLGSENIIAFSPRSARYVRFEALGTVGSDSGLEKYKDRAAKIANLAVLTPKE